jgi:two-component system LytT family response regulator
MVKTGAQYVFVRTEDIDWIESADNYVTLHVGGRKHLLRETVTRMEERLDPDRFLRIRHSTIVNLEKVQAIKVWSGTEYQMVLNDGTTVLSSRRYRPRIRAMLHV